MKTRFIIFAVVLMAVSCSRQEKVELPDNRPTHEVLLKSTPVKNQGSSTLCWIYAMLATIETEHLMLGDSVNLSADFVARHMLEEQARRYYLSGGKSAINLRGMMPMLVSRIREQGVLAFDSYHVDSTVNYDVLQRKLMRAGDVSISRCSGLDAYMSQVNGQLDESIRPAPRYQFMFGAEYTAREFGRSVCRDNEYIALTSFTHHPFGKPFVIETADNQDASTFLNIPMQTLINAVKHALHSGHPVCWEGDISEPGFSFPKGFAQLKQKAQQVDRQRQFESFATTDDHSMAIIGLARGKHGERFFICKNSWGTGNAFGGLMYMSEDYFYYKTIAVMMSREAWEQSQLKTPNS